MKAYLLVTGSLFGLVGAAHLLRVLVEGGHSLQADPLFFVMNIGLAIVAGGLALWAWRLASQPGRRPMKDEPDRDR